MQITIFGANGRVGTTLTQKALDKGYGVRAFVHGSTPFEDHPRLAVVQGDIYDPEAVEQAVRGSEAVLSALGSWGTPKKDIVATGAENIITAMQKNEVNRVITLTGADAEAKGDRHGFVHRASRPFIKLFAGKILADGEKHIVLLEQSGLDWTTIRSPVMNNNGEPTRYGLTDISPKPWQTINRESVALAMLEVLETKEWDYKAPFIVRS